MVWKALVFLLVTSFAIVFSGCETLMNVTGPEVEIELPREAQLIVLRPVVTLENLDPHVYTLSSYEIEMINNLYDNLIMYDGESLTDFLPMISTEVPSVDNGLIGQEVSKRFSVIHYQVVIQVANNFNFIRR